MIECVVCGDQDFQESAGFYYCKTCSTQSQVTSPYLFWCTVGQWLALWTSNPDDRAGDSEYSHLQDTISLAYALFLMIDIQHCASLSLVSR